jgi:hypothetical protein
MNRKVQIAKLDKLHGAATRGASVYACVAAVMISLESSALAQGGQSDFEVVHRTHPGDEVWCRSPAAVDWIIDSMNKVMALRENLSLEGLFPGGIDYESAKQTIEGERIVKIYNVTGGYVPCSTNVAGLCNSNLEYPACHATVELRKGWRLSGTFFVGAGVGFMIFDSDAGRKLTPGY